MKKKMIFTEEQIKNIASLGEVLLSIHRRLVSEGKVKVENGKVVFLDKKMTPKK
ncbi:MAG TPA: hypothetical protein VEC13_00160 [Candidatus Paceibacterota bacterium]|nr:hypothetical protein [Candidatus Paceibacterota bacterium]